MSFPYRDQLISVLGRSLTATDAVPAKRLVSTEERLGAVLPKVVADFYRLAGAAPEFQEHDRLRAPEALTVDGGFLIFMEENQNVVEWGILLSPDTPPDPSVWQRANDQHTWYEEQMTFSEFIVRRLAWTRDVELRGDLSRHDGPDAGASAS